MRKTLLRPFGQAGRLLAASAMLFFAVAGCSSDKPATDEASKAAKPAVSARPAPPDLEEGKAVYSKYCHYCHGQKGYGDGPVGMALTPHPANFVEDEKRMARTDAELFKSISEGIHKDIGGDAMSMPRWQEILTESERWNVLAYIRHLAAEGKKTVPPVEP